MYDPWTCVLEKNLKYKFSTFPNPRHANHYATVLLRIQWYPQSLEYYRIFHEKEKWLQG